MKKYLLLFCLFFSAINCFGLVRASKGVKAFYTQYMTYIMNGASFEEIELLKAKYLSPALIEKMERAFFNAGADQIIRAQDASEYGIKTLRVASLGKDWYLVTYKNAFGEKNVEIPVKAIVENNAVKIIYITAECNGTKYGDGMYLQVLKDNSIDNSTGISFVRSFYTSYLYEFRIMAPNHSTRVAMKRELSLTPKALKQFKEAEEDVDEGQIGYDILISGFDFENTWFKTLLITQKSANNYIVEYSGKSIKTRKISITIVKNGQEYLIDDIQPLY